MKTAVYVPDAVMLLAPLTDCPPVVVPLYTSVTSPNFASATGCDAASPHFQPAIAGATVHSFAACVILNGTIASSSSTVTPAAALHSQASELLRTSDTLYVPAAVHPEYGMTVQYSESGIVAVCLSPVYGLSAKTGGVT